jgi:diacylglycerol kinase
MPTFKQSLSFALKGIQIFLEEKHMKVHIVIAVLVIISGFIFKITITEWLMCLFLIGLVIGFEIINTAIENLVNLVSPNFHPLAGKVKDLAAGAVLLAACVAVIGGVLIFGKYILALLH